MLLQPSLLITIEMIGEVNFCFIIFISIVLITTLVNVYVGLLVFMPMSVLYRPEVVDIGVNTI